MQVHTVPNHPGRLQLPRAGGSKPYPRSHLLHPLRLLCLLRPPQHVPCHHQRHVLRGESRALEPEERVWRWRLLQEGMWPSSSISLVDGGGGGTESSVASRWEIHILFLQWNLDNNTSCSTSLVRWFFQVNSKMFVGVVQWELTQQKMITLRFDTRATTRCWTNWTWSETRSLTSRRLCSRLTSTRTGSLTLTNGDRTWRRNYPPTSFHYLMMGKVMQLHSSVKLSTLTLLIDNFRYTVIIYSICLMFTSSNKERLHIINHCPIITKLL